MYGNREEEERQVKTSRHCQFDFSLSDGQPVFVKLQPNKLWKTWLSSVKSKNAQMLRHLSFIMNWCEWCGSWLFFEFTPISWRSTDIYNKSNKLNWTKKRCFHFPEKSGPCRPWPSGSGLVSPDIWTPVTHSLELNAQNNLGAISVDSKTLKIQTF